MKKTVQIASRSIDVHLLLKKGLVTLLFACMVSTTAIASGIYKWVDENGKTHYGSQRPEAAQAEKVKLHLPGPASPTELTEEELNEEDKPELTPDAKAQKERVAYCATERKRLSTISKTKDIHEKDASGKVIKMSSSARDSRINKIKANISKYCK